jgi:hypothetical protein
MWSQFGNFAQNTSLQNLDYETLSRFKNYNVSIGNSKSTIHLYLRTLRSIYNKGILVHRLVDEKPLQGFWWIKTRSLIRKKNTWTGMIAALENATL